MPYENVPLGVSIDRVVAVSVTARQDNFGYWRATLSARRYGQQWKAGERAYFDLSTADELVDAVSSQLAAWLGA